MSPADPVVRPATVEDDSTLLEIDHVTWSPRWSPGSPPDRERDPAAEGAAKVTLRVLGTNPTARRLYERCGFAVEGVLVGEFVIEGSPVDDLWMATHLRGR
ncbi:MAG: N-acetyltransferase [Actinomycetales bacterium]|nr:MAG: N-acetyltransferase [Actinomycetales bacterium]